MAGVRSTKTCLLYGSMLVSTTCWWHTTGRNMSKRSPPKKPEEAISRRHYSITVTSRHDAGRTLEKPQDSFLSSSARLTTRTHCHQKPGSLLAPSSTNAKWLYFHHTGEGRRCSNEERTATPTSGSPIRHPPSLSSTMREGHKDGGHATRPHPQTSDTAGSSGPCRTKAPTTRTHNRKKRTAEAVATRTLSLCLSCR